MSNSLNGFSTEEDSHGGHDQICCLVDDTERCSRPAGNASYSKRVQKTVQQRRLKLNIDHSVYSLLDKITGNSVENINNRSCRASKLATGITVRHIYICDYHKSMIQNVRAKRKRKDSEDDRGSPDQDYDVPEIDFFQMPVNTLRRYKRHYKLTTRQGLNKAQLADHVARHFKTLPVVEKETLTFFIYMAKNYKSRLDQKHLETVNS